MPIDRTYATEQIGLLVRGGFRSPPWIEERVRDDCFRPEDVTPDDRLWLANEVTRIWSAKLQDEKSWPPETDWDRLDTAFLALEEAGIIALHQTGTEQSDGWSEVAEVYHAAGGKASRAVGFCFYHQQDVEIAIKGHGLTLSFGDIDGDFLFADPAKSVDVAQRVVAELRKVGFSTVWNGQADRRIEIPELVWQKRYRPSAD